MTCDTCGNPKAYRMDKVGDNPWSCDECGRLGTLAVPDVYFRRSGESYENLTDDMGRPVEFFSRGEKAQFMRERGISEAGDKVHGSRYGTFTTNPRQSSPWEVRRQVREAVGDAKKRLRWR